MPQSVESGTLSNIYYLTPLDVLPTVVVVSQLLINLHNYSARIRFQYVIKTRTKKISSERNNEDRARGLVCVLHHY